MNQNQLIVLVALGAAAYMLMSRKAAAAAPAAADPQYAQQIQTAGDQGGWQYFTDGTAIGPDGSFYKNGKLVYANASMAAAN